MDVSYDRNEFDKRQNALVGKIVPEIHDTLIEEGVPASLVHELTTALAFRVCTILDGCRTGIRARGIGPLVPVLAFAKNTHRQELIALDGESSWMHEYVHGWFEELYGITDPNGPIPKSNYSCPFCGETLPHCKDVCCDYCSMDWSDRKNPVRREKTDE